MCLHVNELNNNCNCFIPNYFRNKAFQKVERKHVDPGCRSGEQAAKFSSQRDKEFPTTLNTVFQASATDFIETKIDGQWVFQSRSQIPYWECEKQPKGEFRVIETGYMVAHFLQDNGHFLAKVSKSTIGSLW